MSAHRSDNQLHRRLPFVLRSGIRILHLLQTHLWLRVREREIEQQLRFINDYNQKELKARK